jgi:hypothetical protein
MSNTFNIKRTETNGDGVSLNSVANPRPTSNIDLIIDALEQADRMRRKQGCTEEYLQEALTAARELRELKPVGYMDKNGILFNDTTHPHLHTPLYALEVTK